MEGFKDGYLMSFQNQVPGYGESGGTGPDYGHLLPGRGGLNRKLKFTLETLPVGGEPFQTPDGHRFILFA